MLETKRFVIFRLCPDSTCGSCNSTHGYGEYIVDMATYPEETPAYKEEERERYCEACEECSQDDAAGRRRLADVDCSTCYDQCRNIENMEGNGYVDASEYLGCEKVYEDEDTGAAYYAGPVCANSGLHIKVGLFADED